MRIYIAATLNKWDSITDPNDEFVFNMQGKSLGFLCAFSSYDACKEEYPDRDVIVMETVE